MVFFLKPVMLNDFIKSIREACKHPLFRLGRVAPESLTASRDYLSPTRMCERFLEAYQAVLSSRATAGRDANPP